MRTHIPPRLPADAWRKSKYHTPWTVRTGAGLKGLRERLEDQQREGEL